MKIAVIGAGKWGQALFKSFSKNNECVITSRTPRDMEGFVNIKSAMDSEYLVFSIATQHVREFLSQNFTNKNQKILVAQKGIEASSGKFLHELFAEFVDIENLCFLSGPSFAAEVSQKLPCAVEINGKNENLSRIWADAFPDYIKAYVGNDTIGSEICGAYKNVIAIASGICEGLRFGNSARASLIARGLVEMNRFGKFFGAKDKTFLGLSGAGDLFLTATSTLSRNFRVGLGLASGKKLDEILNELGEVAEGVHTAFAIQKLALSHKIYTPIVNEVCNILNGEEVAKSLKRLMERH